MGGLLVLIKQIAELTVRVPLEMRNFNLTKKETVCKIGSKLR